MLHEIQGIFDLSSSLPNCLRSTQGSCTHWRKVLQRLVQMPALARMQRQTSLKQMPKLKAASDFIPSSRVAAGGDFAGDVAKPAKKRECEHMSGHVKQYRNKFPVN